MLELRVHRAAERTELKLDFYDGRQIFLQLTRLYFTIRKRWEVISLLSHAPQQGGEMTIRQ